MSKYYVMQMISDSISPILKYITTDPTLAFAIRDDLAKQYPEKTYAVLIEAVVPVSPANN